jgi:hypothetical protein
MDIKGVDASCSAQTFGTITLNLVSVRDANLRPQCPAAKNNCTNMGCVTSGTYTPGVERYEFKGTANIGPTSGIPASCCNVRFAYSVASRSNNNTGSGNQIFYIDATINRCLSVSPCNSSPEFKNDPIGTICGNENIIYNQGAFDADDDSLSFSFVPALQDFGSPVTYTAPFAYNKPMPWVGNATDLFPAGIHCDSTNGDIMFTSFSGGGLFTGVVAVEAKQLKKVNGVYQVIGTTRRDIQMVVRGDCTPNNPPQIRTTPYDTDFRTPKTNWEVCGGNQLCFTITAKDTDAFPAAGRDSTFLSWDSTLEPYGATFQPTYNAATRSTNGPANDSYEFCWTPSTSMARNAPYIFTVGAMDSKCPNPGKIRRAFSVKVTKQADISIVKTNQQCGRWKIGYIKNDSQVFASTYIQISKQPSDYQFNAGAISYTNTQSTPDIYFKQPGKYLIKVTVLVGSCSKAFYDTLTIDPLLSVSTKDTTVCPGAAVNLSATVANSSGTVQYNWFNTISDSLTAPLNPNAAQPGLSVTASGYRWYTIQAKDQTGCAVYDSALVSSLTISQVIVSNQTCPGAINGSVQLLVKGGTKPYRFSQDSVLFDTASSYTNLQPGVYKIHVTDSNKCYASVSRTVSAADSLKYTATVKSILCYGSSVKGEVKVSATGGKKPYSYQLGSGAFVSDSIIKNLDSGTYFITIKDANACTLTFKATITYPTQLKVTSKVTNVNCFGGNTGSIQLTASGGTPPYQYKKSINDVYDSASVFTNLTAKGYYGIRIKDNNECFLDLDAIVTQPSAIGFVNSVTNTSCFGNKDGAISITGFGGTRPYQYSIDSSSFGTKPGWTGISAGAHNVTIRDTLLCSKTEIVTVANPTKITVVITTKELSCFNKEDGIITIIPATGKRPFMYKLNNGTYDTATVYKNLKAGQYMIGIRDNDGCIDSTNAAIQSPPSFDAGTITGKGRGFVHAIDSFSIPEQTGFTYNWFAEKGTILSGKTTPLASIKWDSLGMGKIGVVAYKDAGCGDTSSMDFWIGTTGLSELAKAWGLSVYPNPAKQILNITLQQLPEQQTIQLYDMQGKLLIQQDLKLQQQLNIETLSPGIYLLKIGSWSGQVVKE